MRDVYKFLYNNRRLSVHPCLFPCTYTHTYNMEILVEMLGVHEEYRLVPSVRFVVS